MGFENRYTFFADAGELKSKPDNEGIQNGHGGAEGAAQGDDEETGEVGGSDGTGSLGFGELVQIIDYLHDHDENDTDDYRNDFSVKESEVAEPMGVNKVDELPIDTFSGLNEECTTVDFERNGIVSDKDADIFNGAPITYDPYEKPKYKEI